MAKEIKERQNIIQQIKDGILKFKDLIQSGKEPTAAYNEIFKGVKFSYCGQVFNKNDGFLKLYRIIEYSDKWNKIPDPDKPTELISLVSINRNSIKGRCHVKGFPAFYGTNFISSGIMESIIGSEKEYRTNFKDYRKRRFVIGEWLLNLNSVRSVNFLYNAVWDTPTVRQTVEAFNRSISDKSPDEKELIMQTVKIIYDLFQDEDHLVTGALINAIMYVNNDPVDLVFYPSAINNLIATNVGISDKIVSNTDIMVPQKFNYCQLMDLTNDQIRNNFVGYDFLKVGLPDNEKIVWLTDKDSMKRYQIRDHDWCYYGNRSVYVSRH